MSGSASFASVLGRINEIQQSLGVAVGTTPTAASGRDVGGTSFASVLADASADIAATPPVSPTTTAAPQVASGQHGSHSAAKGTSTMFPITPGMTAQQRAAVYVSRLTYAKAHGGLTAVQQAELAKYRATVGAHPTTGTSSPTSAAAKTSTLAKTSTMSSAASSTSTSKASPAEVATSAPAPAVAPGTISRIDGQTYVNIGSFTSPSGEYVPDGMLVSLSSPSSDTYGLLQQLLAVQADPSLLQGSPLASHSMFSDPAQRAANIAQLGGSILASGPAYYGGYSGFSGAQIQQIAKAAQTAAGINLNPALAAAIDYAAAVTPLDAPATAPLAAASIAAAVANVMTINVGSYGSLSVSSLPAGTAPQYATSPVTPPAGTSSIAAEPSGGPA